VDGFASSGSSNTKYYHADLIGTTRVQSTSSITTGAAVYTAFGELVSGTNHRYGYAGEWGYQAHAFSNAPPYLHVGYRYYDPSSGRFLQRDPIGLFGGGNIYAYVHAVPTNRVDPAGLQVRMDAGRYEIEHGLRLPEIGPAPPSPSPDSIEGMQQEMFDRNIDAWTASTLLGVIGCVVGGPIGWGVLGVTAAANLYGIWPI